MVIGGLGFVYVGAQNNISSLSQQNSALNQQVANLDQQVANLNQQAANLNQQVANLQRATVTTITTTQTQTQFIYTTVTSSIYPPTDSTYALTYIDGNATNTEPSCGSFILSVAVTYEIHQQLPQTMIVWTKFDNGILYQPSSQEIFNNQAYLTVHAQYSYSSGYCGVGYPKNVTSWVTDSRNNVLSPSETFVVIT